jgi:2-polyprenyl-3-methyl-5-hydroxy-6-metoxy-1,4-benzoquinol methylase
MTHKICPNCKANEMNPFYKVKDIPVHSVLLMNSEKLAKNYPKRDIELGFCSNCGFISNMIFEENIHEYSTQYEETQGFSETFNKFQYALARELIKKHKLHNKTILEIGCGKGEFISLLCKIGKNKGYGFDPAFIPERNPDKQHRVKFINDYYSEKYSHYKADFICCKMTLEHISETLDFVRMVRNAIGDNHEPIVFFQIPETLEILKQLRFWDIYYEHCSYFTKASLAHLFDHAGFDIINMETTYDSQYLTIEARPSNSVSKDEISHFYKKDLLRIVNNFKHNIEIYRNKWITFIQKNYQQGKKISLWGGGSKSVAFLTTLGISDEIKYVIDINPHKQYTYLPGYGQKIILPSELGNYRPDLIIVMNPIYIPEITKSLNKMELHPELISVDQSSEKVAINKT